MLVQRVRAGWSVPSRGGPGSHTECVLRDSWYQEADRWAWPLDLTKRNYGYRQSCGAGPIFTGSGSCGRLRNFFYNTNLIQKYN